MVKQLKNCPIKNSLGELPKKKGISLVYSIHVTEFAVYMLKYQHFWFYWKSYDEKSA